MFSNTPEEKLLAQALHQLGQYALDTSTNQSLSLNQVMERIQWLIKGYQQVNKGLIRIKTKAISK